MTRARPRPCVARGEPRLHAFQEAALVDGRRFPVELDVVDEHPSRVRGVGQHAERRRVGNEPDLSDRSHALHRLQVVERVHRLHRNGEPDPATDPALEPT